MAKILFKEITIQAFRDDEDNPTCCIGSGPLTNGACPFYSIHNYGLTEKCDYLNTYLYRRKGNNKSLIIDVDCIVWKKGERQ